MANSALKGQATPRAASVVELEAYNEGNDRGWRGGEGREAGTGHFSVKRNLLAGMRCPDSVVKLRIIKGDI